MSMSKFPHLQKQGAGFKSLAINDEKAGQLPVCFMHYEIHPTESKSIELITDCMESTEVFILTKEDLPFLK